MNGRNDVMILTLNQRAVGSIAPHRIPSHRDFVVARHEPTGYHLRGAPFAPVSLSFPPRGPLRHAGDSPCLKFPP